MGENGVGGRAVICPISCKSLHIILCFPLVGNVFISQSFPTFWHTSSSSSIILFAMINDFIIIVNKSLDRHVYLLFWRCVSGLLVYTLRFDRCTPECQSLTFMLIIKKMPKVYSWNHNCFHRIGYFKFCKKLSDFVSRFGKFKVGSIRQIRKVWGWTDHNFILKLISPYEKFSKNNYVDGFCTLDFKGTHLRALWISKCSITEEKQ